MNNHLDRIYQFKGNPHEIGLAAGRALGAKLEQTLAHYIARREHASDMTKLHQGALPWLRRLPKRFQDEFEGMAEGAQLPLQGGGCLYPNRHQQREAVVALQLSAGMG